MRPIRTTTAALALIASLGAAACTPAGTAEQASNGLGLVFAANPGTGCQASPIGQHVIPPDVDWFVVQLLPGSGTAEPAPLVVTRAELEKGTGEYLIRKVEPGTYAYDVTGCRNGTSGPEATWWGRNPAVDVVASGKASPVVFMMPDGRLACVGGQNQNALVPQFDGAGFLVFGRTAFAAGAKTPAGRVFVAGGVADQKPVSGVDRLSGGQGIWEFDRATGVFLPVYPKGKSQAVALAEPRMMHQMVAASDDALVVFGGVQTATLSPKNFPGPQPPLMAEKAVTAPIEVLSLADGTAKTVAAPVAALAATAVARDGTWIVMAGGAVPGGALAVDDVTFVKVDAALATATSPVVVSGKLAGPRFGGAVVFLGTQANGAQALVIGGSDGTKPAAAELVTLKDGAVTTEILKDVPPAGVAATAFPSALLLRSDGDGARVLVLGGSPVGDTGQFAYPEAANAMVLWVPFRQGRFDAATTTVAPVGGATGDWAIRAMATAVRFGTEAQPDVVLAGGFRSFSRREGLEECKETETAWPDFCFPRSLDAFRVSDKNEFEALEPLKLPRPRLGALLLPLDERMLLVLGGLAGFGGVPPAGWAEPTDWQVSGWILSSGMIAVRAGSFDSKVCADHAPAATP